MTHFELVMAVISLLLTGASWLAWRNHRAGRGDVSGAMRLAAIGFVSQSLPGTLIVLIWTLVGTLPMTSDLSAWYASRGLFIVGLTLALAVWSFRHALGGRKVLKDGFLDG